MMSVYGPDLLPGRRRRVGGSGTLSSPVAAEDRRAPTKPPGWIGKRRACWCFPTRMSGLPSKGWPAAPAAHPPGQGHLARAFRRGGEARRGNPLNIPAIFCATRKPARAAAELFARRGISATKTAAVARKTGVLEGTLAPSVRRSVGCRSTGQRRASLRGVRIRSCALSNRRSNRKKSLHSILYGCIVLL